MRTIEERSTCSWQGKWRVVSTFGVSRRDRTPEQRELRLTQAYVGDVSAKSHESLPPALKIRGILHVACALVLRMRGIGAQRAAAPGKRAPCRRHRFGSLPLFHPIHGCAQHVEAIKRRAAAAAMTHAGRKEQAAPILHFGFPSICRGHALVVIDGVLRGEPWVTYSVIEDELASM